MKNSFLSVLSIFFCVIFLMTHNAIAQASEGYQTLVAAEAYVDDHQLSTDLDLNNVIAHGFAASSGLIDIAGLSRGAHTLFLRMQDETGEWSKPIGQNFYIANEGQNTGQGQYNYIQQAELYFDTDPGEGQGISITVPEDGVFNQSYEQFIGHELLKNISSGLHTVYVRVKDANGLWSVAIGQTVSVDNSGFSGNATGSNYKLKAAEAYFDIDPGLGDGLAILNTETQEVGVNAEVLKGLIDIAQLTDGIHTLYIRYQNQAGLWSQSLAQSVFITPDLVDNNISLGVATILSAEYALDGGVFQQAPLADGESGGLVEEINFTIPVTLAGYHSVEVRFTDSKGRTSQDSTAITATANDQDWDGLPDAWEKQYLGGTGYSANDDPDNDGLSNGQEYLKGTDPLVKDETGIQTIAGFVTDVDGNGIANLAICIEINVSTTNCNITTDAQGHYVLGKDQSLVPATYRVYPKSDTATARYGYNPVSRSVGLDLISVSQINFVAEPLAISLSSPTTSATYQAAQSVTLNWQGNGRADMPVTLFMKRNSVANSQTEANTNDPDWHIFTASTDNDGSETITFPTGLTVANNWRFYVGYTGTTVQGSSANNFSYEELVINFPVAEIISYQPQEPIEGEVLTLTGKVTAEGQSIVQHYWGVIPLQDGQEIGDETQIGSAAILSTQELAAGEWRFVYQVRNDEGLASESAVLDLEVLSAEGLADLVIDRAGIRMLDQDGNPVVQVETGDLVTLKVAVHNKGRAAMQDFALLSVYDDMPETGVLLATGNVRQLAAGETQELEILWTVPEKQGYQALVFNLDFEKNLRSEQTEVFESNRQNNLVTAFLIIGTPPPGSYGINMTMSHQVPSPYAVYSGDRLTITGDAHYMWGSRLPVMGAVLTVTMQGKTVPAGYTMSPTGRYSISVQAPKELGEYKIEVKVFDSNLYAQKEIIIDVRERPVAPPPQPPYCQIFYCPVIPSPTPVAQVVIKDVYYTGTGLYRTDSGINAAILGSTVGITAQVKNVGNLVSTKGFSLRFYEGTPEKGGIQVGDTIVYTANLAATGVVNYVATEQLDLDSLGRHSIYATVTASEGGVSTRTRSVDVREYLPDLRPYRGLSFSSRPIAGERVNVSLDVLNRGPADLNQPFEVHFYNADPKSSSSASLIGKDYISASLAKGEVVRTSISLATQQAGDFAIFALIDYDDDVEEDGEYNNVASNILHVCPATIEQSIGLQVSNRYPGVKAGITLTATVANRCGLASPADSVSFYNGNPNDGGLLIGSQAISELAGSASTRVNMPWQTPETAGEMTLYVKLNKTGLLAKYTIYVTETPIPTPNLQVYSADIVRDSLSVDLNQQVQLSAYIRNVSKEQEASGFSVNFYVDSLTKFTQVGETIVINQALATESQILVQATAKFTADEPYYAILVEVIPNIEQGDTNFSDNKATTSFAVRGFEFINRPPVANDLVIETLINKSVKIDVLKGVSDPENEVVKLTAVNSTSIKHGKATFDSTGVVTYTPATNATDDVEFTYHLTDASGKETIKKISVKVRDVEISTELRLWPNTPAGLVNSDSLLVALNCKTDIKDSKGNLSIAKYQWDFGDGKTKTVECGKNCSADSFVQHRYETRGRYKASCTAVTEFDVAQSHDKKHVLFMPIDTDLDALPDAWEEFGVRDGNVFVDLKSEVGTVGLLDSNNDRIAPRGASVGQKDIFLWVDYMFKPASGFCAAFAGVNAGKDCTKSYYIEESTLRLVKEAFNRYGINLIINSNRSHRVEYVEQIPGYRPDCKGKNAQSVNCGMVFFRRENFFQVNRASSKIRESIYRYMLLGNRYKNRSGGTASTGLASSTAGAFIALDAVGNEDFSRAGTIMHEFGHVLGLGHGGPYGEIWSHNPVIEGGVEVKQDSIHFKPNYLSVMNYLFQLEGIIVNGNRTLDFSRFKLSDIDESSLPDTSSITIDKKCIPNDYTEKLFCQENLLDIYQSSYFSLNDGVRSEQQIDSVWLINWNSESNDINWDNINNAAGLTILESAIDWGNLNYSTDQIGSYINSGDSVNLEQRIIEEIAVAKIPYTVDVGFTMESLVSNSAFVIDESRVAYSVRIYNSGQKADDYHVKYDSPLGWKASGVREFHLEPGQEIYFQIFVTSPSDLPENNENYISVEVISTGDSGIKGTRSMLATITSNIVIDTDNDGIPDDVELELGTDPASADTDGDGLNDIVDPEPFDPNPTPENLLNVAGDLDLDGDIDKDDLKLMRSFFGQAASGIDDSSDINADGFINVLDFRLAAKLCTRLRCATHDKPDALPADFDLDGDVDRDDLLIMRTRFNQQATSENDPFDINTDGFINVLDYRLAARLCTRSRCATQ